MRWIASTVGYPIGCTSEAFHTIFSWASDGPASGVSAPSAAPDNSVLMNLARESRAFMCVSPFLSFDTVAIQSNGPIVTNEPPWYIVAGSLAPGGIGCLVSRAARNCSELSCGRKPRCAAGVLSHQRVALSETP